MSNPISRLILAVLCAGAMLGTADARLWSDKTGKLVFEAELFAFNDEQVVLRRKDGQLGMYEIKDLSEVDQRFLKSQEALKQSQQTLQGKQVWKTKSGFEVVGRAIDYDQRDIRLNVRRGKLFVNDRLYDNMPDAYKVILRRTMAAQGQIGQPTDMDLQAWIDRQAGKPVVLRVQGVLLEQSDGEEYLVPFSLFADADAKLLRAGWDEWMGAPQGDSSRSDEAFRLQSTAAAIHSQQQLANEIAQANMAFNAVNAGLFSYWEVTMYPQPGNPSTPGWVVVAGRNSEDAKRNAMMQYPGFVPGPIRKVSR